MKLKLHILALFFFGFLNSSFGQSIFTNPIIDANPSAYDPFTIGQIVSSNIFVSGIGRGIGIGADGAVNRFNARDWHSASLNSNDYFEFTLSPKAGFKINFIDFAYKAQVSSTGPVNFVFRSNLDNYTADIATPIIANSGNQVTPMPINLSAFTNITTSITFRLYGWGGSSNAGTFSINEFTFNGSVICADITAPTSSPKTAETCSGVTANWAAASGASSYLLDVSTDFNFATFVTGYNSLDVGNATSYNVIGLAAGITYYYRLRAKNSCYVSSSSSTQSFTTLAVTDTNWNGSAWSNGVPSDSKNIVFSGNYTSSADLSACSCQVTAGDIIISTGNTLTIANNVAVTGGSLTFNNNSSLIQLSASANSGNITVKRSSTPIILDDYTYWSAPTTGSQTLSNFAPNAQGDKYFDYNNDWAYVNAASRVFSPGIGYAISAPVGTSASTAAVNTSFKFLGVPNNGSINIPVTVRTSGPDINTGERLIGNPYLSALDADAFIKANIIGGTGTKTISGTLYFWTHNHTLSGNNYSATDYATYNLSGGVAVGTGTGNKTVPSKYIASGQGFFVEFFASGNVNFNNEMRVGGNNTNFYKMESKKGELEESSKIWLNLTNHTQNFSQTLIGYVPGATNNYDPGYDSSVYDETQPFSLYSVLQNYKLSIQGRRLPFSDMDIVPLGYSIDIAGTATISVDHMEGVFAGSQNVYLEDLMLKVVHNIKAAPYSFNSENGTFNDRFVLIYSDYTLGVADVDAHLDNQVLVSNKNKQLTVASYAGSIDKVIIFDVAGKSIYQKIAVDSQELTILNLNVSQQVLLVKVVLEDGKSITKKIIY